MTTIDIIHEHPEVNVDLIRNVIRKRDQGRLEIWHSNTLKRSYFVWKSGDGNIYIVVVNEIPYPLFIITAYLAGSTKENPMPPLEKQWEEVLKNVCFEYTLFAQYTIHLYGNINDPLKPYYIEGIYARLKIPIPVITYV